MTWILEHKAVIGAIAAFALSELLPFLPTKYNGIAQMVLGVLGKKTA